MKKYRYTFKQLEKMLGKKINYAFNLTYKNRKYILYNLENHTIKIFYRREDLEYFIFEV